ncbi:MAG: hypothetical protein JXR77_03655 [Lentisphaeria bacterium]|nr:hypothetical protein [Lentisphaeria bacterium]
MQTRMRWGGFLALAAALLAAAGPVAGGGRAGGLLTVPGSRGCQRPLPASSFSAGARRGWQIPGPTAAALLPSPMRAAAGGPEAVPGRSRAPDAVHSAPARPATGDPPIPAPDPTGVQPSPRDPDSRTGGALKSLVVLAAVCLLALAGVLAVKAMGRP